MVKAAARRLASRPAPGRPGDRRAVPHRGRVDHRPDRRRPDHRRRHRRHPRRAAAPRSSTRSRTLPEMFAHVEGRHVVILLTDGYDENSSHQLRRRRCRRCRSCRPPSTSSASAASPASRSRARRCCGASPRRWAAGRSSPIREDELPNVHATVAADAFRRYLHQLHAEEPGGRRHVPRHRPQRRQSRATASAPARATSRPSRRRSSRRIEFSALDAARGTP